MKKGRKKDFIKQTQKRGISLIVLIVTIIVIIILAAELILTISKNNPIESAREARFKENVRSFQDELFLTISKEYTNKQGKRDIKINATGEDVKNYIPSFTKEYEGKLIIKNDELIYVDYKVTENEISWLADLGIKSKPIDAQTVADNAKDYYGLKVTNYSANGIDDWKIFYADENNVYIITSEYVPVDKLPTTSAGNKPENKNSTYPNAAPFDRVVNDYKGTDNITDAKIKALNNDYFNMKGYSSTNVSWRAVAYMLDTSIWSNFAGVQAEYATGGPTIEMLMSSYNQKYKLEGIDYRAKVSSPAGYKISLDGGKNWESWYLSVIKASDSLYVISDTSKAAAMWLASPSDYYTYCVMSLWCQGNMPYGNYSYDAIGFRPLVCLRSDIILKAVEDGFEIH